MGNVRNALRTALCANLQLDEALDVVDFLVRGEFSEGAYASANLATLNVETGAFRLISAGHPGPLIHTPDGTLQDPFTERGLPLGLRNLSETRQSVEELRLQRGSFAVFFTDGVIEWERDELAGYAQLKAAMMDAAVRNSAHPAYAIRRAVVCGPHADDIALMSLQYGAAQ
jgi:serine phosphatase RsbU (regulator of sigma subunit)